MTIRTDDATVFGNKGFGVNDTTGAIEPVVDLGTAIGTGGASGYKRFAEMVTKLLTMQSDAGALMKLQILEEEVTLGTGALTTDTTANLLPANSLILGIIGEVTTTITTSADWKLGDASTADRFTAANSTLTAGTISYPSGAHWDHSKAAGYTPYQASAAKVRITMGTSNPGAGKVRVTVFALTLGKAA